MWRPIIAATATPIQTPHNRNATMLRLDEISLPLDHPPEALAAAARARLGLAPTDVVEVAVVRRGHDARRRGQVRVVYTLEVALAAAAETALLRTGRPGIRPAPDTRYRPPAPKPGHRSSRPVVVGAGPCGLLAAMVLAEAGLRPIVLERGKAVRPRTIDTFRFWRQGVLDPGSNVQFGEGGAGTFSDGKLYSGITERANRDRKVLEVFVSAGAPAEILVAAKPHIGTFRLVSMVERMRARIEELGGEYRFGTKVEGLVTARDGDGRRLRALRLAGGGELDADQVVLAPGHSARDSFAMLHAGGRGDGGKNRSRSACASSTRNR